MTERWEAARSVSDDLLIAHHRLINDPSITVYVMRDGVEIREPIDAWRISADTRSRWENRFAASLHPDERTGKET